MMASALSPATAGRGVKLKDCDVQRAVLSVAANAIAICGDQVAVALKDGSVRLWSRRNGNEVAQLRHHNRACTGVSYGGGGQWLVSSSLDKTCAIWGISSPQQTQRDARAQARRHIDRSTPGLQVLRVLSGHDQPIAAVAVHGDRIATASWDATARVWTSAGDSVWTLRGHTDWVQAVAFLSEARLVSGASDASVRVWSLVSGATECVLAGHGQSVMAVTASSNGDLVASASLDSTVRVWGEDPNEQGEIVCVARLRQDDGDSAYAVSFSPDDATVIAALGCVVK